MPKSEPSIEEAITQALIELDAECEQFGVRLLLIGGFAVRVYGQRKRETTDLDFVTSRVNRNALAEIFKRLGYQFDPEARFGMKATRPFGNQVLKVDISVERIHDEGTGSIYLFQAESFVEAKRHVVESLSGDLRVEVYVVPLADLLISKLMTVREQDASDAINLILANLPLEKLQAEIARKARQAGLTVRINSRIAELVKMPDGKIQTWMERYFAGRLTVQELRNLRSTLRSLKI